MADLMIWFGWTVFSGSLVVPVVFAVMALALWPVFLPREERALEKRFGDAYREFQRSTPRWVGKPRR